MLTASVSCQDSTKVGPGLVVELLARQGLPDGRPFRARGGHDVVDLELAKRLEDRLAPVEIVLHLVLAPGLRGAYQHRILPVRKAQRRRAAGTRVAAARRAGAGRGLTFGRPRTISASACPAMPGRKRPRRQDFAMKPARKTLRRPDDLIAAGLLAARTARRDRSGRRALRAGADRRRRRAHRSRRSARPDRAPVRSRPGRARDAGPRRWPIRSATMPHSPVAGIVHRYPDRVLLKPVHVCAVYCRFCFRREVVGRGARRSRASSSTPRWAISATMARSGR